MEKIQVNGEFLFELKSKQEWINKVPRILPEKKHYNETWLWIDCKGNQILNGSDFINAENKQTYPVKVYRLITLTDSIMTDLKA